MITSKLSDIDTPALLIDAERLHSNIDAMAAICANHRIKLRPHMKTHKSPEIAHLQITAGAIGMSCAKLTEAEVMVESGIEDVLITTPVVGGTKPNRVAALAKRSKIRVVADSEACIAAYAKAASDAGVSLDVLVEVNVGQNRCGVKPGPRAAELAKFIAQHSALRFIGLQGYQGLAQSIIPFADRRSAIKNALDLLLETAEIVRSRGFDIEVLTGGGSGSLQFDLEFEGLSEIQPGSYVFMDTSYERIAWDRRAAPPPFVCSLSVLTTVISRREGNMAIVDAGWKALSCDSGVIRIKGRDDLKFEFVGDEHGAVRCIDESAILDLEIGQQIQLLPGHCDTTVALHDVFHVVDAEQQIKRWPIAARGCFA